MVNTYGAAVPPSATGRAEATADRSSAVGIAMALLISREPALGSGPAQPFIPIGVGRGCGLAPCSRAGIPINPFGFRLPEAGGRRAPEHGTPNRTGTDLDSPAAENQISCD